MSDQPATPAAPQPTPTPVNEQQQPSPPHNEAVPYERFVELRNEHKAMSKELAELRAAEKQRKDAELTELQKWQNAAKEHENALKAERLTNAKLRIAAQKGLPADLVDRLHGDNEEALAADADKLLQFVTKPAAPGVPPSRGGQPARLDINSMTPAQIREHASALMQQARQ